MTEFRYKPAPSGASYSGHRITAAKYPIARKAVGKFGDNSWPALEYVIVYTKSKFIAEIFKHKNKHIVQLSTTTVGLVVQ